MTPLAWILWGVSFVACGAFFTWLTRAVVVAQAERKATQADLHRLREHEHRQNNALQVVLLLQRETALRLGVPAERVRGLESLLSSSAQRPSSEDPS